MIHDSIDGSTDATRNMNNKATNGLSGERRKATFPHSCPTNMSDSLEADFHDVDKRVSRQGDALEGALRVERRP